MLKYVLITTELKSSTWSVVKYPFSVWIHSCRSISPDDYRCIKEMIERKCYNFVLSGKYSQEWEDSIDDLVEDYAQHLTLTSASSDPVPQTIEEVLGIKKVDGDDLFSCVAVILCGDKGEQEKLIALSIEEFERAGLALLG